MFEAIEQIEQETPLRDIHFFSFCRKLVQLAIMHEKQLAHRVREPSGLAAYPASGIPAPGT